MWRAEMLVFIVYVGLLTKVYTYAVFENGLAVESLTDGDGVFDRIEGTDDSAHGFERGESSHGGMVVDCFEDVVENMAAKDLRGLEVRDEEGIARRRRLRERRKAREIER